MTSTDPRQAETLLSSMPYPTAQDEQIRKVAGFIGADGILALLDRLRIFVAGDIGKVLRLADEFANNRNLLDAKEIITQVQLDLNPVWQGDAASQFGMYANSAATTLNTGQTSMVSLTKTMSSVASAIADTYLQLIAMIGKCAITLEKLWMKMLIAGGGVIFPPLAAFEMGAIINDINDAFATFWQDCLNLMTALLKNMTNLATASLDLHAIGDNFPNIPKIGSTAQVVHDPERWRIRPGADHS